MKRLTIRTGDEKKPYIPNINWKNLNMKETEDNIEAMFCTVGIMEDYMELLGIEDFMELFDLIEKNLIDGGIKKDVLSS